MENQFNIKCLGIIFFLSLFLFTCKKGDNGDGVVDEGKKEQQEKATRAEHNNKLLSGSGNVYVAAGLQSSKEIQLVSRSDYQQGYLAYYARPESTDDIGVDHRFVYSMSTEDRCILELDESLQTLRMYTERSGKRLPLMVHVNQYGAKQFELQLYSMDWGKGKQELLGSVYLRDGHAVGVQKRASVGTGKGTSAAAIGFLGCQRPANQSSLPASVGAYMAYVNCFLEPLVSSSGEGMVSLGKTLAQLSENETYFGQLSYDMEAISRVFAEMSGVYSTFKTDPLESNDPLKTFNWYGGAMGPGMQLGDARLSLVAGSSHLVYDAAVADAIFKLTLQVQDKDQKAIKGNPVFVDFRIELEQGGKQHVLLEQTISSDKTNGLVSLTYDPRLSTLQAKPSDSLRVFYRLSAQEGAPYSKQQLHFFDREPAKITIVSGNNQEASWQETLKSPFVVKVTNKAGQALKDVNLSWKVRSVGWGVGVGQLSQVQSRTDEKGLAQAKYTVSMQQEKPETVLVQVLGTDGKPIPKLETTFIYKQRRNNFSLVIVKPMNIYNNDEYEEVGEWKNGDNVMLYYDQGIDVLVKLDGKIQKDHNGKPIRFILSSLNMHKGPATELANHPFQAQDVSVKNCPIRFPDPRNGATDSIVVNLTISNAMYRKVVGKTITAIGSSLPAPSGYLENHNAGEKATFSFRSNGKVHVTSVKHAVYNNKTSNYSVMGMQGYSPVYRCDSNSAIFKKVVGIIYADSDASSPYHNHFISCSFILFEDGTLTVLNSGTGYHSCSFTAYWKSLTLQ